MQKIKLTTEQKVELEYRHDKARDSRVRDRIKAILLCSEGWTTPMIAQALRLHETTIIRHINDYLKHDKLKLTNGGSTGYLSFSDAEKVTEHLAQNTYRYSHEIAEYIWVSHQVRFSTSGLNKWLHQQGFSYKKPKLVPHKFDTQKQTDFIEEYRQLKSQVIDAVHPTQATKISYGWIKKGGQLNGVYTQAVNQRCSGHLFQGRYKAISDMLNIFLIRPKNLARLRVCSLRTTKLDRLLDSQQYLILGTIQR